MSRLQDALARLPMPDSPATQPWEFSGGAFLGPYLPGPLRRAPKLLDRLGAVRLGPAGVGLDTHGTVAWSDVVEIRTCSLFELMGDGFAEDLRRRSSELVPPLPGLGKATRWAADRVAELALSMFLLALPDAPERGVPDVAAEIAYRDRRARQQRMIPGLVAGAVLTLPAVRASVLATAARANVPVVARGRSGLLESAGARAAVLEQRRMQVARQIERLRGTDGVVDDIEEGEDHVRPIPVGNPPRRSVRTRPGATAVECPADGRVHRDAERRAAPAPPAEVPPHAAGVLARVDVARRRHGPTRRCGRL